ncbi:MAG: ABC transporter permease [Deltaproteobacteria bacterium]|nr:MAG: ABC transporter permease [Deltaproteobacteria bacterium]
MRLLPSRIKAIARKELFHLFRDRRMLPIVFIAPIIQLTIFGYAATMDVKNVSTVYCDNDRSAASRELLRSFASSGYFRLKYRAETPEELESYLIDNRALLGIVIPAGLQRKIKRIEPAPVQLLVDGSNSNYATIVYSYAEQILANLSYRITLGNLRNLGNIISTMIPKRPKLVSQTMTSMFLDESEYAAIARKSAGQLQEALLSLLSFSDLQGIGIRQPPRIDPQVRVWFNPTLTSVHFMVPGVICLILLLMTMVLTSMAIVREREAGTIEQLVVTPIRPYELIIGKLLPFIVIGFIDVTLIILVATLWFKIRFLGSVVLLYLMAGLFLMTTLGMGLLISTVSRTQQQAMMTCILIMPPFMMLSGVFYPIENMPQAIQQLTYLIPLRYFIVILRTIFLKGAGLEVLWNQALGLGVLGLAIIWFSIWRFKKKLE